MKLLFIVLVCFIGCWCGAWGAKVFLHWRAERKVKRMMKNAVKDFCKFMGVNPKDVDWKNGVIKIKKGAVKDVKSNKQE